MGFNSGFKGLNLKPEREGPLQVLAIGRRRLLKQILKILDGKV